MADYNFAKFTGEGQGMPGLPAGSQNVGELTNATSNGISIPPMTVWDNSTGSVFAAESGDVTQAKASGSTVQFSALDNLKIDEFSSKTFSLTKLMDSGTSLAKTGLKALGKYVENIFPGASSIVGKVKGLFSKKGQIVQNNAAIVITEELINTDPEKHKCIIQSVLNPNDRIIFKVTPTIDETRSANYDSFSPPQHPGAMQMYKSTTARTINVNGKFLSRTTSEADETLHMLNTIRSWVMPYYGKTADDSTYNVINKIALGTPPDILKISAYGSGNLKDVPVVLQTYNWTYPEDVDYIFATDPTDETQQVPIPRIIDITLTLTETYSPEEYSNFDIYSYKEGDLTNAFKVKKG
jgi:hypothetical protein